MGKFCSNSKSRNDFISSVDIDFVLSQFLKFNVSFSRHYPSPIINIILLNNNEI